MDLDRPLLRSRTTGKTIVVAVDLNLADSCSRRSAALSVIGRSRENARVIHASTCR